MDTTNELVTIGTCPAPRQCEGKISQGLGGEGMGQLSELLKQAMEKLMQGGGGGGGGMGEFPTSTYEGYNACTSYYVVNTPSTDPCAIYNPTLFDTVNNGGSSGVSDALLDALGSGGSNTNTGVSGLLQGNAQTNTGSQVQTNAANTDTGSQSESSNTTKPASGLSGDVRLGAGATIFANLRQGLSEVASFFGGSGSGSASVASRICSTRPWAGSFVSAVIPDAFFDGICEWRGYQVGVALTPSARGSSSGGGNVPAGGSGRPSSPEFTSDVPPEVDIWAEPASVRLGTRTYIFWNARGVSSCIAQGPSFEQRSLSGGASTVPITGPTTFSIECVGTASTTVRDSVTVNIAI